MGLGDKSFDPLQEERITKLADVIERDFDSYLPHLDESYERVMKLLSLAKRLVDAPARFVPDADGTGEDILRAAVVLTHAFLEDFLRTLTDRLLPEGDSQTLKDIPLSGLSKGKSQYHVGHLVQHKGKTVDALIRESVHEYLERSTFNNTTEIAHVLEKFHIEGKSAKQHFPALDKMIQRRHDIVHRSDRVKDRGSDKFVLQAIHFREVRTWLVAVRTFTVAVVSEMAAKSVIEVIKSDASFKRGTQKPPASEASHET